MSVTVQPLIEVENLRKAYPDALALDGLTFSLSRGEIVGLLGANGAGKTTATHILLGILTPTSGHVSVLGRSPLKDRAVIAEDLNFSSAYVQLPSNLKVIENLRIFARLYRVKDSRKKIDSLLDLFEIGPLKNRVTGSLSSGEKTRLNLAKCLLNRPSLLLLDEPTASLDPEMADTVRTILKRVQREEGIGILYTSHNMPEVEAICDRVLFLHKGRTIAEGTPSKVMEDFRKGSLEQVFIQIVRGGDLVGEEK